MERGKSYRGQSGRVAPARSTASPLRKMQTTGFSLRPEQRDADPALCQRCPTESVLPVVFGFQREMLPVQFSTKRRPAAGPVRCLDFKRRSRRPFSHASSPALSLTSAARRRPNTMLPTGSSHQRGVGPLCHSWWWPVQKVLAAISHLGPSRRRRAATSPAASESWRPEAEPSSPCQRESRHAH